MPNDVNRQENEKQEALKTLPIRSILRRLWRIVRHNWAWKLGCLLLALCLWGTLITQNTSLVRTKIIQDVTINVLNAETLQRNGYVVVSGLEEDKLNGVRIKVDVPQKYYDSVTAANYNVRVDLSKIRSAGEQVIPVISTSSATYGSVTDLSTTQLTVVVEEYMMRSRIPVRIESTGQSPDGFYAAAASVDPIYIAIGGPRSQIETVAYCVAQYDMSYLPQKAGTARTAVSFVLCDKQGNVVDQSKISVSTGDVLIDSITVEQTLYDMMLLPVATTGMITGTPRKGYAVKSISIEPAYIRVAFKNEDSHLLTHVYPQGTVDLTDATNSVVASVPLSRPADAYYISADSVYVTIEIGPADGE